MATRSSDASTTADSLLREIAAAPDVSLPADLSTLVLLEPGVVVDGMFRIDERLGAGGMGVVFAARDLTLDREVALKLMRLERGLAGAGGALPALFEQEARATARLNHPNVVTLHQFGAWNGLLYLVLERLRGETLHARLERGPVPLAEALAILEQVARALVHTHQAGIVHRDLKPQNVFLLASGEVKVLDFGVSGLSLGEVAPPAGLSASPASPRLRSTLARAGTPGYMAPEQWWGGPQDERTDLWAMGTMLHQLVTGALPFGLAPVRDDAVAPRLAPLPPVAAELAAITARCLSTDRDLRPSSAAELAAGLARVRARLDASTIARNRARRRRRAAVAVAAIAAAVATAVVGVRELRAAPLAALVADIAAATAPPVDLAMVDFSGRWNVDRGRWRLTRRGADRYFMEEQSYNEDTVLRVEGELRVVHRDRQVLLVGTLRQLPVGCCDETDTELTVVSPDLMVGSHQFRVAGHTRVHTILTGWIVARDHTPERPGEPLLPAASARGHADVYGGVVGFGDQHAGVLVAPDRALISARVVPGSSAPLRVTIDDERGSRSGLAETVVRHPSLPVVIARLTAVLEEPAGVPRIDPRRPVVLAGTRIVCVRTAADPAERLIPQLVVSATAAEIVIREVPNAPRPLDVVRDVGIPCFAQPGILAGILDRVEGTRGVLVRAAALTGWLTR